MSPQLQERFSVYPEDYGRQQNALRVFDTFHEQFIRSDRIELDGKRFSPAQLVGVGSNPSTEDRKMLITIHTASATQMSDVLIAGTDGETAFAHAWAVSKAQERDDIVKRDKALFVHRWFAPEFSRSLFQLERVDEEGYRQFAKLVLWDDGRCELYSQEFGGHMDIIAVDVPEQLDAAA